MSYCEMLVAPEKGEGMSVHEYGNSWGGAARIWSSLCKKLYGEESKWLFNNGQVISDMRKDSRLTTNEKIALYITYDKVMIRRENLPKVAAALREFVQEHPCPGKVDHLSEWSKHMDELSTADDYVAICFTHTSVGADSWQVWGEGDNDQDDRMYDLSKDSNHFFWRTRLA